MSKENMIKMTSFLTTGREYHGLILAFPQRRQNQPEENWKLLSLPRVDTLTYFYPIFLKQLMKVFAMKWKPRIIRKAESIGLLMIGI